MLRLALAAGALYLIGKGAASFSPGSIFGALEDIGFLVLMVPAVYYSYRALVWLKNQLLWKVRNRILISYTFVALFPLVVVGLVATVALVLTLRAMSGFYLEQELKAVSDDLDRTTQRIVREYYRERSDSGPSEQLTDSALLVLDDLPSSLEGLSYALYELGEPAGRRVLSLPRLEETAGGSLTEEIPEWVRDGFGGLVSTESVVYFANAVQVDEFLLVGEIPFESVIDYMKSRTGIEIKLSRFTPDRAEFETERREFGKAQDFFSVTWVHFFTVTDWSSGEGKSRVVLLSVPLRILLAYFFAKTADPTLIMVLALTAAGFLLTILVSLVIGAALARGITRSIHNIYVGAKSIQAGDFDFRIPSSRRDQLDAMADSFNSMSSSIVGLMNEVSEKERLEKEIEIAKEVQNQLFPQSLPPTTGLEIAANCMPARQVSGDYYDFLASGDQELDIVVGDISGKGISAALMMASLQASIRSRLTGPVQPEKQTERMAEAVAEVNKQLYRRSSPEIFSTLVINHYDSGTRRLAYCNAGHHPPLLFSNGTVSDLTIGGTVVGLFENWDYEGAEVQLEPGDLLVFFTDGVVEAEREDGEQFGTERLIELLKPNTFLTAHDIQALILEQVFEWSGTEDQSDDITVVSLKVLT